MKRLLSSLTLVVASGASYASCDDLAKGFRDVVPNQSDSLNIVGQDFDAILDRGYLTFAVYEDFAPFSWEQSGKATGIDIDLAKVIAEEIGVEAHFNFFAADENVDADFRNQIWKGPIVSGSVSNVMMHAPYNKDLQCRNEFVVLGGQYFNEKLATAYRNDIFEEPPTTPFYRFHKVGVENHTISAFYLENFGGGMLLPNVRHYDTREAAYAGLAGEVDAVMGMKSTLEYLDQSDNIEVATPPLVNFALNEWTLGIAVNFRYRELYYTIDGIIEDMVKDGRMEEIFARYRVNWLAPDY
ncbi:MAG: substrate-binding periplasmic protein [Granulosicoccaceae bacterium]